ncbi:MAG: hypothetical protein M1834_007622 [Cirrosporium novae-zelandiae]|nr:MAG: hypothetical protein M1834_007622 [Cirrosporium novae-zelandiae]
MDITITKARALRSVLSQASQLVAATKAAGILLWRIAASPASPAMFTPPAIPTIPTMPVMPKMPNQPATPAIQALRIPHTQRPLPIYPFLPADIPDHEDLIGTANYVFQTTFACFQKLYDATLHTPIFGEIQANTVRAPLHPPERYKSSACWYNKCYNLGQVVAAAMGERIPRDHVGWRAMTSCRFRPAQTGKR